MKDDYEKFLDLPKDCVWRKIAIEEERKFGYNERWKKCMNCNGTLTTCINYQTNWDKANERNKYGFPKGLEGKKEE